MNDKQFESLLCNFLIKSHVDTLPLHAARCLDFNASCMQAIELMNAHKIGCVLVNRGDNPIAGIFTERDVINKVWHDRRDLSQIPLSEVMTSSPEHLKYHASVAKALYLMDVGGFRHIPVIAKDNSPAIISVTDFVRFTAQKIARMLEKFDVAEEKSPQDTLIDFFLGDLSILLPTPPLIVTQGTLVSEAIQIMVRNRAGSVIVGVPEKKTVQGIFTERDIIKKVIMSRGTHAHYAVETFMTQSPVTLQPTTSVMYAFNSMNDGKFRHIPIVDYEERAIGMISSKNFVHFISTQILSTLENGKK